MAVDTLLALQSSVTKTATFNGAGVTLPFGTSINAAYARVLYSAASNASGSNTVIFSVDVSLDGGSTWQSSVGDAPTITLSTTVQAGELYVPFVSPLGSRTTLTPSNVQVRLTVTIAGAGTSPTITYQCDGMTYSAP